MPTTDALTLQCLTCSFLTLIHSSWCCLAFFFLIPQHASWCCLKFPVHFLALVWLGSHTHTHSLVYIGIQPGIISHFYFRHPPRCRHTCATCTKNKPPRCRHTCATCTKNKPPRCRHTCATCTKEKPLRCRRTCATCT